MNQKCARMGGSEQMLSEWLKTEFRNKRLTWEEESSELGTIKQTLT